MEYVGIAWATDFIRIDPDLDRGGADLDQGALMDNDDVAAGLM